MVVAGRRTDLNKQGICAFRGGWLRFCGGLFEQKTIKKKKMKMRLSSDHIELLTVAAGTVP